MKTTCFVALLLCWVNILFAQSNSTDQRAIKQLIETYKLSINQADTLIGAKVWADVPEVSFIHPKGHELGWKGVKDNFYGMFRNTFQKRHLTSNDEVIHIYPNVAWVEFYWDFDAKFKDGTPLQTKGRETQILRKIKNEWRIVHIHYSGMPLSGQRQGF
ncbi:YybH family protein [Aquirufa rosea]|uniref:DUF4440 domain-containing protein n=1 Tax=Aquirufa rosea TaxID=2509241 RepID=A0A4Q1BZ72_9BACT|nr:nuclear transport factor 2 family protein [Aquirufa rosea]RXK48827.1 DUF4440 domain-containing protein [Aquirufa rosea]